MVASSAASQLHAQILAACPIDGVSVGLWGDKATWRVDFKPEATQAQRGAAQAVVNAFDPSAAKDPVVLSTDDVLAVLVTKGVLQQKDVDDAKAAK